MVESHHEEFSPDKPLEDTIRERFPWRRILKKFSPGQRMVLSVFLFLDVCVICLLCLVAFQKIALPF